ncbi:unnamed protein product [Boreogadus saida]
MQIGQAKVSPEEQQEANACYCEDLFLYIFSLRRYRIEPLFEKGRKFVTAGYVQPLDQVTLPVAASIMAHICVACAALLELEDGHDSCPPCLGLEHLRESLTDSACMNCSLLPWVLRVARLAELENRATANNPSALMSLPPNQPGRLGRQRHDGAAATGAPPKKKARGGLAAKVDGLAADMEQMRSLLLALQPGTGQGLAGLQPGPPSSQFDDALSLAASANLFNEVMTEGDASHTLDEASCSSAQGSLQGATDTSMAAVLRTALAHLQLDAAQTESAQASAFFRRNPVPATFSVPPSEEYLKELHACWRDTRALSHSTSDARTLAVWWIFPRYKTLRLI